MTGNDAPRITARDRWTYQSMNDPRARRMCATRARRVQAVLAHLALTAVATTSGTLLVATGQLWWCLPLFAALLLWMPVTGMLNAVTRGLLELRPRMLDERQAAERAVVLALAHRGSLLVMVAALGAFGGAHWAGAELSGAALPLAVTVLAVALTHWLLPLWIAAWRVPDEPADEEWGEHAEPHAPAVA
ncbi:hypothetical protein [Streptomyces oceani]|uniref:Uncharacterized protein n=1 Tax=Streptomyces oceani TaxID=1075402 RepID=A0A1E7KMU9_9ACTN|nr:hypothetical protein [Streptomyces oceani]OEV05238.1 hypothetical protein AN216_03710 [Streptomyces oceani]